MMMDVLYLLKQIIIRKTNKCFKKIKLILKTKKKNN